MAVDPYSPCPCGSGQKFKWCCHKVEAYADRAHRLFESGQTESAVEVLDEGLRKEQDNAWLLARKALYLTRAQKPGPAKEAVRRVLAKNPAHAGALMLMTRLVLETEGPEEGAAQLQQALTALPPDSRGVFAGVIKVVGAFLSEAGEYPAALRHLRLAQSFDRGEPDPTLAGAVRTLEGNPAVSAWQKNPDPISPPPASLKGEARERFEQAVGWADSGLWSSAAAAFDTLSGDPAAGPLADRNLGFCRLWLADDSAAVSALRRYAARLGPATEAVDLEALCQQVAPPGPDDQVEHVQLVWPVRNRGALLHALKSDRSVHAEEPGPIDPDDPGSPEVDQFVLLDRPEVETATADLKASDVPRIVGRVLVGAETVALETYDDGRLDRLAERFTSTAGSGIPPAHPKTKRLGKVPRLQLALMWEWLLPEGVDPAQARRLTHENGVHLIGEVWPATPNSSLHGRTPLQAGLAGDAEVPLRAALLQLEQSREGWREHFDFAALRARLRVPPEPPIDPETVDVASLHVARLVFVPADRLSDDQLNVLYRRARQYSLEDVIARAAAALVERPEALDRLKIEGITVYTDLASIAAGRDRMDEAFEWVRRGRAADPPAKRARFAPSWDIFEVQLRARGEAPEVWVPELVVVLERYRPDPQATQSLMMSLIDMGLLEMVPNPDRPGEILLDSRPLQALLTEYGPRVTTASGQLGVSATKPEIWTPGGAAGAAAGGLWTPGSGGSASPPGGEKKLIIPGR